MMHLVYVSVAKVECFSTWSQLYLIGIIYCICVFSRPIYQVCRLQNEFITHFPETLLRRYICGSNGNKNIPVFSLDSRGNSK